MNINISKTFATRDELDSYVRSRFGEDATKNAEVTLELSAEEMQTFALDETTTVHGVKVVAATVDSDEEIKLGGKVSRVAVLKKVKKTAKLTPKNVNIMVKSLSKKKGKK